VTIVMPTFNDEAWVGRAIDSCLAQSEHDIEIICVDDASTDETCRILDARAAQDDRVCLIKLDENQSAFQARRLAIEASLSPYVMFLDGDDELNPLAVETALARARVDGADVVAFGVEVRSDDGSAAPRFERSLQPILETLEADRILPALFPPDVTAQGHLWRYLWRTDLLKSAYDGVSSEARFYRANDLPITFLALMAARKYVATPERLYVYYFRRGTSGHGVSDLDKFAFYLQAIDSVGSISERVSTRAVDYPELAASYGSARRSILGNILGYLVSSTDGSLQERCLEMLRERVDDDVELLRAAVVFQPDAVDLLAQRILDTPLPRRAASRVLLTTGKLGTGGVQGVLVAQSHLLASAGFDVTVAVFGPPQTKYVLPSNVQVIQVAGVTDSERIDSWRELIRDRNIDVVIDHHVLYNVRWPMLALAARSMGVPTIGWLHNFALRPMVDGTDRTSFLQRHLPYLSSVVVLSRADVAFWKTQGISNVVYLPNPLPSWISEASTERKRFDGSRLEIVWWGRLQQSTKQVRDLIEISRHLENLDVDFHLTIIGPDSADLSAHQLRIAARRQGVEHRLSLVGPVHGEALADRIREAHVFVSTSLIEGYPLTLVEAQAHGLPVVMYELPWLAIGADNDGIVALPQGDKLGVANALKAIAEDSAYYSSLSSGSIDAARRALSHDFATLYLGLIDGELPPEYSPDPSVEDAALLLRWSVFYSERAARIAKRRERNVDELRRKLHHADGKLKRTEDKLKRVERKVEQLQSGWSFRVGRIMTFIPRKILKLGQSRSRL